MGPCPRLEQGCSLLTLGEAAAPRLELEPQHPSAPPPHIRLQDETPPMLSGGEKTSPRNWVNMVLLRNILRYPCNLRMVSLWTCIMIITLYYDLGKTQELSSSGFHINALNTRKHPTHFLQTSTLVIILPTEWGADLVELSTWFKQLKATIMHMSIILSFIAFKYRLLSLSKNFMRLLGF